MKYKAITDKTIRAYKSMGNWGIGATIIERRNHFSAQIDIGADNNILILASDSFASMPTAKAWVTTSIRKLINELGKWTEE